MDTVNCIEIFKALGDKTRLKIFEILRDGKACACTILENLSITQPTLSHHMKILCGCGIVISENKGKWTYYYINCGKLNEIIGYLGATICRNGEGD